MTREARTVPRFLSPRGLAAACAIAFAFILPALAGANFVYWTDSTKDTIERSNLDGSGAEIVLENRNYPEGIVVDLPGNRMFWTEGNGVIWMAQADGTGPVPLTENAGVPAGLAIDFVGEKIYWTDVATGQIRRMNLDGSNIEPLVAVEGHSRGIALDLDAGQMYLTGGSNTKVQRANLDGSELVDLIINLQNPLEITLDIPDAKMYFANNIGVYRADLDGSNLVQLLQLFQGPSGIEIDRLAGKIYISSLSGPYIQRADLDGSNLETLVESGPLRPRHLTLGLSDPSEVPSQPALATLTAVGNYPDPFRNSTTIRYRLSAPGAAVLRIHDVTGRIVRTLLPPEGNETRGVQEIVWNGLDDDGKVAPTGVYLVAVTAGRESVTSTMVRIR